MIFTGKSPARVMRIAKKDRVAGRQTKKKIDAGAEDPKKRSLQEPAI